MKKILFLLLIANIAIPQAIAGSPEFERRVQEQRRLFEQRAAENHRKFEERVSKMRSSGSASGTRTYGSSGTTSTYGSTAGSKPTYGTTSTYGTTPSSGTTPGTNSRFGNSVHSDDRMKGTSFDPLPFDAARAPSPDLCFLKFVTTAKSATNINQVMDFLPFAEARTLKECQQQYDPAVAAGHREQFKRDDPKMSEASLTHLTQDPYSGELQHCREIAVKVLRVRKITSIKGNKAILDVGVRANATQNGVKYPYGTAEVEMLGEGSYWKFAKYNDSNVFYRKPQ